ncbi:hypothetical protein ACFL59_08990 [Planctomycetota bacterium]
MSSLDDLEQYLEQEGLPCKRTANGSQLWYPDARGMLLRLPITCTDEVDCETIKEVLSVKGAIIASYLRLPDSSLPANVLHYVCSRRDYSVEQLLSRSMRRDVRLGMKRFVVGECTWDEVLQKGFEAYKDTKKRHGYREPRFDELRGGVSRRSECSVYEAWGVWQERKLAAWASVMKVDDWAVIHAAHSCNWSLKSCPNNILVYRIIERMLVHEQRKWISIGFSSLQVGTQNRGLHRFKMGMGFTARPCHRVFIPKRWIGCLLSSKLCSIVSERVSNRLPTNNLLRRVAGISKVLSGRLEAPLGWGEPADHS